MKNRNKNLSFAAYPYVLWSAIFIVIPLLLIVFFSFTSKVEGRFVFSFENFQRLFEPIYFTVFIRSIWLAVLSTVLCLILGYPIAYMISKLPIKRRNMLILLFILPMWMNFLLRTYAWMAILGRDGLINTLLGYIGIDPIKMLYTDGAILLGMVYNFLPFMVIPIYTVLIKIDKNLVNAAYDLGANKAQAFRKVILPLSIPGIISGITMVFMPAVSNFVIPNLLGGGKYMLVGNLIEQQFTTIGNWNFGSALSIFMMILILISMAFMSKYEKNGKEGGKQLW
ncbi:TPA: ABC transporter permease [Clostridium perfringens]|uniref:ABC transporter permease n=1 Tax=Clostridium perfringens TaxID=1502 RepID=UPI001009A1E3|nr:ABC transporter permease [Clostridium perfringens]EJT5938570.1 ABC transporter permease [Clostridium perfringens]EJT6470753.1 ABC transporter permease [Clostridium perfringens]MDG6876070.1 Spermidine/putrescine transport system permease protein PotB [Clostridium perfringens]MDG6885728.1 Spermidine/putrescine transport system permease protein PotB [Clostridium perfringens]MDH5077269.1 Spermidine/putrescine transport system permease protein PotB [Clostridium perfringens]